MGPVLCKPNVVDPAMHSLCGASVVVTCCQRGPSGAQAWARLRLAVSRGGRRWTHSIFS